MKKFLLFAAAGLCAMSISAAPVQFKTVDGTKLHKAEAKASTEYPVKAARGIGKSTNSRITFQKVAELNGRKAAKNANGTYDIEGEYVITIGDYYFQTSVGDVDVNATIEYDALYDGYWIKPDDAGFDHFASDVLFDFDSATNTMSFSPLNFGTAGAYYVLFAVTYWNGAGLQLINSYSTQFDPATGSFEFDPDYGFGWPAFADSQFTQQVSWFGLFDVLYGEQPEPFEIDEIEDGKWETVEGKATLAEAWFTPILGGYDFLDPLDYAYEVELQRSVDNEYLFRLWEPFKSENHLFYDYNESEYHGQIVFDITDPDHVVVKAGLPAGLNDGEDEYFVYSLLGWQLYSVGNDESYLPLIIEFMEEEGIAFDTYDEDTRTVTINLSIFDTSHKCKQALSWTNNPYETTTIVLPEGAIASIKDIATESNDNARIEYFNLQGIRVDTPAAGQVVIRKQGDSIAKTIVR